jgi:alpha-galactosidase
VRLVTLTDLNDTLVEESRAQIYSGNARELFGQIFILTDKLTKSSDVIIIPAPDYVMPSIRVEKKIAIIESFSYPAYIASCEESDAERVVRSWYREHYSPAALHAMSNTWGDRNGRTRVSDEFIRREIDSGADLGLDVVQIDDGWQKGIPNVHDELGNKLFEGDFWELKRDIFPNGMRALSDYAHSLDVELGLWFAPHARGVFEHYERDVSVLEKAYKEWGIRYFKLDMIDLPTRAHCEKMTELLDKVTSFGDSVAVELDVTANKRLGYLAAARYGTIFVENRYTAWGNYYPHRTLRNIWMLSRYIPTAKCQFELINPELYTEQYDSSDPYRHECYTADYLFASVMLSNPLFWMETQFLSDKARSALKSIIPLWKQYRAELTEADVYPIAEEPSGSSLTGFIADCADAVHLLLFREVTERDSLTLDTDLDFSGAQVIKANAACEVCTKDGGIVARISEPRSYVWLRASKQRT